MLRSLLICVLISFFCIFYTSNTAYGQVTDTTHPVSVDPDLLALSNSKTSKEYTLASIKITGTKYLDESLLISISGLTVGDKIVIPGGDNFSKAINNLWKQNLFSNVAIYITKLSGNDIYIEINVTEKPRLRDFSFKGSSKSESDDLQPKTGLIKGRVVTENMKRSAIDAIQRYYAEKGYPATTVKIIETKDGSSANSEMLTFMIQKGVKVHINEISFFGNEAVSESKLKKQLKDTKELTHFTLFPTRDSSTYGQRKTVSFKQYVDNWGFLSFTQTKEFLDPYFRFKLFSGSKFNAKKFTDDKQKVIDYYNSLGYRDATIVADTQYYNKKGQMDIDIKVEEGHKYYFGNIGWKGNTKYSDSILNVIMGIKKGDIYNLDILRKKLQPSAEGGDISGLYQDDGYLFFRIDPVETAVYNDTIDFEIRMVEGPQATIKNVTITGNEKTKEYVIRRELRTIPGEKFSRTELIRSQRDIVNLGFFNQEKVVPN